MAITLSVIALIVLISFYDYFSARNWQQVTSSTRNDIVFASRNKEYGAYVIRKSYDKKMLIIFLSLCFLIGASYGTLKIFQNMPEEKEEESAIDMTQVKVKIAPVEVVIPPPTPPPPPPLEKLVAFLPPVVVDEIQDTPPVIQEDLEKGKIDVIDQDGEEGDSKFVLTEEKPKEVEVKDEIEAVVDEVAEYPGGQAAFKAFLENNLVYPQIAIEENLEGKCFIGFVVDREGNMSDFSVLKKVPGCPECDAEALRVVKKMPKWTPGKKNGKPVKSRWQVPITYKLN